MISEDDSNSTYEFKDYFKILSPIIPNKEKKIIKGSFKVRENFSYRSNINKRWLSFEKLKVWIKNNQTISKLKTIFNRCIRIIWDKLLFK